MPKSEGGRPLRIPKSEGPERGRYLSEYLSLKAQYGGGLSECSILKAREGSLRSLKAKLQITRLFIILKQLGSIRKSTPCSSRGFNSADPPIAAPTLMLCYTGHTD